MKKLQTEGASVDLHLHTTYSDGSWSPVELVQYAINLGLQTIAITDHDTTDGIAEALSAAGDDIRIISGIEINTIWNDPDTGSAKDVHILGYYVKPEAMERVKAAQQAARLQQMELMLEKMRTRDIHIEMNELLSQSTRGSIGRPHLAKILIERGLVKSPQEAFDLLMKQNSPFYVPRMSISPKEAIQAIREAGGIASWAHPGKDKDLNRLLPLLKTWGLCAIEAYHRSHSRRLIRRLSKIAGEQDLLLTGGSDCHGPYKEHAPSIGTVCVPPELVRKMDRAIGRE